MEERKCRRRTRPTTNDAVCATNDAVCATNDAVCAVCAAETKRRKLRVARPCAPLSHFAALPPRDCSTEAAG